MKDPKDRVTPEFPEMEGDFIFSSAEEDQRLYDAADQLAAYEDDGFEREPDFMGRLDKGVEDDSYDGRVDEAYEESHFHFTLMAFEDLLYDHGLPYLLDHMSKDTVFELLRQADHLVTERKWKI